MIKNSFILNNIFLYNTLKGLIKKNHTIKFQLIQLITVGVIINLLTGVTLTGIFPLINLILSNDFSIFENILNKINLLNIYKNHQNLVFLVIILFVLIKYFLIIFFEYLISSFTENVRIKWSKDLILNNLKSNLEISEKINQGKRVNDIIREPFNGSKCIYGYINFIFLFVQFLIVLFSTFIINLKITIGIFVFLLIFFSTLSIFLLKRFQIYGAERVKAWQSMTTQSVIAIKSIKDIKILNFFSYVINKFEKTINQLKKIIVKINVIKKMFMSMGEVLLFLVLFIIIFILDMVDTSFKDNLISYIGIFTIIFSKLFQSCLGIFRNSVLISNNIYSLQTIVKKRFKEEKVVKKNLKILKKNKIEFKNVAYSNNNKIIFNNLNLKLNLNKFTILKGSSGSGKSTISDLIFGFKKPDKGKILFNNQNILNINLTSLRKSLQYIPQNNYLINDTFLKNLTLNKNDYDKDFFKILIKNRDLNITHKDKNRINEIIKEDSSNISGGEKKRISIFRSLLLKPIFIIFDETTSSISEQQEFRIFSFLKNIINKKYKIGFLIITHSNKNIDFADEIIDLDLIKN